MSNVKDLGLTNELLSAVNGRKSVIQTCVSSYSTAHGHHIVNKEKDIVFGYLSDEGIRSATTHINIHELAHELCIQWALREGYFVRAELGHFTEEGNTPEFWCSFCNKSMSDGASFVSQFNITSIQAIFKACQWILEKNKDTIEETLKRR